MKKHIQNLSDCKLLELKWFNPSHDLNFGLPQKFVYKKQVFAEFESLWAKLQLHSEASNKQHNALKARLTGLAHIFYDSKTHTSDFVMQKECFIAINKLRNKNTDTVITKPDKGSVVAILNKCDYIKKMENILADPMKF